MMQPKTRGWVIVLICTIVFSSFYFNSGLRKTLARRKEIRETHKMLEKVSGDIDRLRKDIKRLKEHPESYEIYVRRELGYLKPGEKEIRFIKPKER